ncbi:hypothetical protein MXL46_11715 [Heyndrickxia sporothermodurans]|uniref:hypothetical protein n=1 Tax=Heyndrickxia sporothermodurans TaxID=46224 RepID=UPI002DB87FF4|nr:hypothetical protein [Heyndrickxia sporothermodurans]MEB6549753.1 hypothetical protein [Heyndrickxia sporothermodurans]
MEAANITNQETMTVEEAVKLANEIERIEAAAKQMKADLRSYVEQNGPVETADTIWNVNEAVSYKFDAKQLKEVAQHIALGGDNPWDYLGITASNLKKLGWDEAFLAKLGKKTVTKRFASRKK